MRGEKIGSGEDIAAAYFESDDNEEDPGDVRTGQREAPHAAGQADHSSEARAGQQPSDVGTAEMEPGTVGPALEPPANSASTTLAGAPSSERCGAFDAEGGNGNGVASAVPVRSATPNGPSQHAETEHGGGGSVSPINNVSRSEVRCAFVAGAGSNGVPVSAPVDIPAGPGEADDRELNCPANQGAAGPPLSCQPVAASEGAARSSNRRRRRGQRDAATARGMAGRLIRTLPYLNSMSYGQLARHQWSEQFNPLIWCATSDGTHAILIGELQNRETSW